MLTRLLEALGILDKQPWEFHPELWETCAGCKLPKLTNPFGTEWTRARAGPHRNDERWTRKLEAADNELSLARLSGKIHDSKKCPGT